MLPVSLEIGPDGAMYVSSPAIGANNGEGVILRLIEPGGEMMGQAAAATCAPLPETLAAPGATPITG
jgi:hypothetical protein